MRGGVFAGQRRLQFLDARGVARLGRLSPRPRGQQVTPLATIPDAQEASEFVARAGEFAGAAGLLGEGSQSRLDLADDVAQAGEVALGEGELLFGVVALR